MIDSSTHIAFLAPDPGSLTPLFPGYEIESLIATGGMGAVYCAIQKSLDRTVAIKILPQEFSKNAAFCAAFEAEAKSMARLNHPNLIGVYDFGEVEGMLFMVMEYVAGKSLFHSAHGIAIDPDEVIRLVTSICNGLAHAHENGIIHRDIKPSNILLDLNAQPKIGDFGLAQAVEKTHQAAQDVYGTPHYTAPEVVHAPHMVGCRADIFSVGVILHELLTGRLPKADRRSASTLMRCDARFDAIIRRATNPQPELRYASAAELAKDLQAITLSPGTRGFKAPAVTPPPSPRRSAAAVSPIGAPLPKAATLPKAAAAAAKATAAAASAPVGKPVRTPVQRVKPVTVNPKPRIVPTLVMLVLAVIIAAGSVYYFSKLQKTHQKMEEERYSEPSMEPYMPAPKPKPAPLPWRAPKPSSESSSE